MPKADKSFAAFAVANPPRKQQCFVCTLAPDLRAMVKAARLEHGGSYDRISRWLATDHNVKISDSALRGHFARGHDAK